jgi:hypothetical protein
MDRQGRLYTCEYISRRVTRTSKSGKIEVLAEKWEGRRLNAPNDIVVRRDGHVYFTDPLFAPLEKRELDFYGVYHITPKGQMELVAKPKGRPNGIALSPDGKILYVASSDERNIRAYDVDKQRKPNERGDFRRARWTGCGRRQRQPLLSGSQHSDLLITGQPWPDHPSKAHAIAHSGPDFKTLHHRPGYATRVRLETPGAPVLKSQFETKNVCASVGSRRGSPCGNGRCHSEYEIVSEFKPAAKPGMPGLSGPGSLRQSRRHRS